MALGFYFFQIYVSNLPFHYRANDLENLFISRVGGVAEGKGFVSKDCDRVVNADLNQDIRAVLLHMHDMDPHT